MAKTLTVDNVTQDMQALDVEATLRANMKDWPGVDPQVVEEIVHWVNGYKSQFLGRVASYDSEFELPTLVAISYIEFKAVWIGLNTVVNYKMFRGQEPDAVLQWKGTAISALLEAIEPYIAPEELENIGGYLNFADVRTGQAA